MLDLLQQETILNFDAISFDDNGAEELYETIPDLCDCQVQPEDVLRILME